MSYNNVKDMDIENLIIGADKSHILIYVDKRL